ncbi:hypothetical protein [Azospirillum brasilense]|uniref:hypothetical protein n=1 Tax=Azospirillum brasilense TaxID=192 RepID=UPI001EDB3DB8|nr:hypothetical protein [Azospirillum brasilense]UKJ76236.1 hypothetical protein H1Q64_24755 [Azospirillum brasilense]
MTVVFHSRTALLTDGVDAADAVARTLEDAWRNRRFGDCAAGYAARHGAFDPEAAFFCPAIRSQPDSAAYQAAVRSLLVEDIGQSRLGEADSPTKAALELFRVLRPQIRSAVDFGGLTPASHQDFRTGIAPLINRAVIGPPLSRNEELLALIDAGIVRAPFGPAPDCRFDASLGRWTITSTALGRPHSQTVDRLIAGHLDQPEVEGSASPLLSGLAGAGRIRAYRHGDAPASGIDIDPDSHPLDRAGRPQPRLWVLGPLTEGARYFNHYLPSPKSRSKAFAEADACLDRIMDERGGTPGDGTGTPAPAAAFLGPVGQDA